MCSSYSCFPLILSDWVLIILGFTLGLSIDILSDTPGLHAAATVFMAFIRPFVIKFGNKRQEYETTISYTFSKGTGLPMVFYIFSYSCFHSPYFPVLP